MSNWKRYGDQYLPDGPVALLEVWERVAADTAQWSPVGLREFRVRATYRDEAPETGRIVWADFMLTARMADSFKGGALVWATAKNALRQVLFDRGVAVG
jgi:hypothetical protein